jgi:epoxyqueuosine reductase
LLAALTQALGRVGLHIVRPVSQDALDREGVAFRLEAFLPGARTALVIGDGGPAFFAGFSAAQAASSDADPDPLERYTVAVVSAAVATVLPADVRALRFPFGREADLPIQSLGRAAGIPPGGPLGLQIHPQFGPWWAYRALLLVRETIPPLPPLIGSCAGCSEPCASACPVGAPTAVGFQVNVCAEERERSPVCGESCGARSACIVGSEHRYPPGQLGFHMRASLAMIRSYRASTPPPAGG